jgi:hypothetical protein
MRKWGAVFNNWRQTPTTALNRFYLLRMLV